MARVTVRRVLLLAVLVGVLFDLVVPGHAPGLNALIVTAALLLAAALVADPAALRRFDPVDAWLPVAALVLASMAAVRADPWLVTADVLLAGALLAGSIAAFAGTRITRGVVPRVLEAAGGVAAAACVGTLAILQRAAADRAGAAGPAASRREPRARLRDRLRPWMPVLRGLLLAAPIVVLFALLFASADAVFAGLARTALGFHVEADLDDLATRATVIAVVAWGAAGLLALAGGLLPALVPASDARPAGRSLGAASAADLARGGLTVGSTEAATILVVVDLLFAAFVALQLAYLFGGRDTLAIAGMTYSDYARRGFFELVAVAVLAGMLVVCLELAVRWRSRAQLAAGLGLLALTGVVLVSAFVRLRLYQDAYGWTELRFVVLTAIAWLAVALAATAWLVLARQTRWTLHVLGILSVVTLVGMNLVGPQAYVADRNLERALDPALVPPGGRTGLDGAYLASLGDEAVPSVVAAFDRLGPAERAGLARFLHVPRPGARHRPRARRAGRRST